MIVTCQCGRHFATPEANAGKRARCVVCGHEMTLPVLAPPATEVLFIPDAPGPTETSGKAIASFTFGVFFIFACLSGLPAIWLGVSALREIDRSGGRLTGKRMAATGIVLGVIGCLFTLGFMPSFHGPSHFAYRAQCINNLKQIGLAVHNYHTANGCLPPAAITDKDGRPLLSWRVAILPFMEAGDLYARFHLDEPWDSPHNLSLLDAMPYGYACPTDRTLKKGMSNYLAVIGSGTAFEPDFKRLKFEDFTDGTETTVLVGESRRSVPWTMPDDLRLDIPFPVNGFGSHHENGFNAVFVDGSAKFLKNTIDPKVLRALLTRDGSTVDQDSY